MLRLLLRLFKLTYGRYIIKKYHVISKNQEALNIEGSYLILSNHVNNHDPFFIQMFVPRVISYVTAHTWFSKKYLGWMLSKIGAIPKKKFVKDLDVIRNIITSVEQECIIGIFPEGRRNWDGQTNHIIYSTAKLIRILRIPVIACTIKGGMLSYPRWAKKGRTGQIECEFKQILSSDTIKNMTTKELYEIIIQQLAHDEYEWQKENKIKFIGDQLAEKLETYLFCCPKCKSMNTLVSNNQSFTCKHCDYKVIYNDYGYFEPKTDNLYFETTKDWGKWQIEVLRKKIEDPNFMIKGDITLYVEDETHTLINKGNGYLSFKKGQFHLVMPHLKMTLIPKRMSGSNIHGNNKWQFYYDKTLYRVVFNEESMYGYQWYLLKKILDE